MNRYIGELIEQLDAVNADAHDLCDSLTEAQFNWTPQPGAWSIGQCIDHLNIMNSRFCEKLSDTIADAKDSGKTGEFKLDMGLFGRWVFGTMDPPVKMKVKVPEGGAPHETMIPLSARDEFFRVQDRLAEVILSTESLNWNTVKMTSPYTRWLRLRLSAWLYILPAHDRRHLWQARNVLKHASFPA